MTLMYDAIDWLIGQNKLLRHAFYSFTNVQDTFFTAMLSGRISSQKDDSGYIFIDRDPELFR